MVALRSNKNLLWFFSTLWSHFETTCLFLVTLSDNIALSETTFETTLLTVRRHLRQHFLARRHLRQHFLARRHCYFQMPPMSSRQQKIASNDFCCNIPVTSILSSFDDSVSSHISILSHKLSDAPCCLFYLLLQDKEEMKTKTRTRQRQQRRRWFKNFQSPIILSFTSMTSSFCLTQSPEK